MVYLASPYSHPDPAVREQRFHAACRATAALLRAGCVVFSPIVHSHALVAHGVPTDWAFWQHADRRILLRDRWRGDDAAPWRGNRAASGIVVYVPRRVRHKARGNLTVLTVCVSRGVMGDIRELE
jgi:hypothetical protein